MSYYWKFIQSGTYIFDQRELAIKYLDTINKNDLLEFFREIFVNNRGKVSI